MRFRGLFGVTLMLFCSTGCSNIQFDVLSDGASEGGFWSSWGPSADDIWVVGGQANAGAVMRGNTDGFASLPVPDGTPLLNWVHGTGTNDVWVGGLHGTLLHWNGAEWSDFSVDVEEAFWGVYAVSPDEVYAVGGLSGWGGSQRLAMRYDGSAWSDMTLPSEVDDLSALFKVHHDGQDVWIVGARGHALVGDGEVFEPVSTGVSLDVSTIHSRGDGQVVAVGGRETGLILMGNRVDGLTEVAQAPARLFGVHVLGSGDVVVGGMQGYLGQFQLDDPTLNHLDSPTQDILHGVFGHDEAQLYAVGGNIGSISDDFKGVILTSTAP